MKPLLSTAICLFLFPIIALSQSSETIRVCTYNLSEFGEGDNDRTDEFRAILDEIAPSVLMVQGITSIEASALFNNAVLTQLETPLQGLPLVDPDNDLYMAIYLDTSKIDFISAGGWKFEPGPRSLMSVSMRVRATGDTITTINGHWKDGEEVDDESARWNAARATKNWMRQMMLTPDEWSSGVNHHILFGGSMNVYGSGDPSYQMMVARDAERDFHVYDPISRFGSWYNNEDHADVHTAVDADSGLRARFDLIMYEATLREHVVPDTYTTFGNDGEHFNEAINALPNRAVSAAIAQALHDASDHLPVYVDFLFQETTSVESESRPIPHHLELSGRAMESRTDGSDSNEGVVGR